MMRLLQYIRCTSCHGQGEVRHPDWADLIKLWAEGYLPTEQAVREFWAERGYERQPAQFSTCRACGGTGDLEVRVDAEREHRAVRAWRENNSLVSRLVELHRRDPALARRLAYYIERWHGDRARTRAGEPWPYQWLMVDVASWPNAVSEEEK